jgi:hypothetical protein
MLSGGTTSPGFGETTEKGTCTLSTSVQRDQQRKANAKNDERNEEVNVRKNCADFFEIGHRSGSLCSASDWRNHNDASRPVSTCSNRSPERILNPNTYRGRTPWPN